MSNAHPKTFRTILILSFDDDDNDNDVMTWKFESIYVKFFYIYFSAL